MKVMIHTKEEREKRERFLLSELKPNYVWNVWRDISAWDRFGIIWEEAQKKEWWVDFVEDRLGSVCYASDGETPLEFLIEARHINPDHFSDALAEFLTQRKEKS